MAQQQISCCLVSCAFTFKSYVLLYFKDWSQFLALFFSLQEGRWSAEILSKEFIRLSEGNKTFLMLLRWLRQNGSCLDLLDVRKCYCSGKINVITCLASSVVSHPWDVLAQFCFPSLSEEATEGNRSNEMQFPFPPDLPSPFQSFSMLWCLLLF